MKIIIPCIFLILLTGCNFDAESPLVITSMVSAGGGFSLYLNPEGSVYSWGANQYGQLGYETNGNQANPREVTLSGKAARIAAGRFHSLALIDDGTVISWGRNNYGQLGNSTLTDSFTPVSVSDITDAVAVFAGEFLSGAVLKDGTFRTWGSNLNGQLGNGSGSDYHSSPVEVTGISIALMAAAGTDHVIALLANGNVQTWGWNNTGQLGDGTMIDRNTPTAVNGLNSIVSVGAGSSHSIAVHESGSVRTWGYNLKSQLGNGGYGLETSPITPENITSVRYADGGFDFCIALHSDDTVTAWGGNGFNQLGTGIIDFTGHLPQKIAGLTEIDAIAAGDAHCLALSGKVIYSWGRNDEGQLGDGSFEQRLDIFRINM